MPSVERFTRPRPVPVEVRFDEDVTVNVVFDRNQITPAWVESARLAEQESAPLAIARAMAQIITDWDVTQDDGSPYPPTAENLSVFSFDDLRTFILAIVDASRPSSEEGNASSGQPSTPASGSAAPAATPLNGPATLVSPVGSA